MYHFETDSGNLHFMLFIVCGSNFLAALQDYRMMRWQESGGVGGGTKMPLVRKLLVALLRC